MTAPGRRALLSLIGATPLVLAGAGARAAPLVPLPAEAPEARPLLERLRAGGLVLYFRHAGTLGQPCDRSFRVGDRPGQRTLSAAGRAQAMALGPVLARAGIPLAMPVLAGPVYRARDTAELAFGAANVEVTESLLADDFAGPRLAWVLQEHRRLFSQPVPRGRNRVLVGHRTPAIMVAGAPLSARALPEAGAAVIEPLGEGFRVLGVLVFVPLDGDGFHSC
jgi:phosphohistidine phosphatase SixA